MHTMSTGFLPNGDLILVGYDEIYKYSFINKPTNESLWKYSQIYNINTRGAEFVYQTKLFIFDKGLMTQWDLSTIIFEIQYNLDEEIKETYERFTNFSIVINKNQTLFALHTKQFDENNQKFDIYSMETGIHISSYGQYYFNDISLITVHISFYLNNLILFYSQKIISQ